MDFFLEIWKWIFSLTFDYYEHKVIFHQYSIHFNHAQINVRIYKIVWRYRQKSYGHVYIVRKFERLYHIFLYNRLLCYRTVCGYIYYGCDTFSTM